MNAIINFALGIGLEIVREKITDSVKETQVKQRITDYLKRQQKLNLQISCQEEIDFSGIAEYIRTNLMDDVKQRFYGNAKERGAARQRILEATKQYATANTKLSIQRVEKIVGFAVDVLSDYYRKRANRELLFITGEIEDTIKSEHDETRALIEKTNEHLESIIQDGCALSVDRSLKEIKAGNIKHVEANLNNFLDALSTGHTLFPNYGFRMTTENKIVSFPLTDNAQTKYPENFKITFSNAKIGNTPVYTLNNSVLEWAYRHQLSIYVDIEKARKYLGDVLDPIQTEANKMIGAKIVIKPSDFPAPFPCYVSVGEDILIPYLLLRTKDILDDCSIIVTNEEQKNFHFAVRVNLNVRTSKLILEITQNNASNIELLHYKQFLKRIISGEKIFVYTLDQNKLIVQGTVDKKNTESEIDKEIKFLQRIIAIENYFDTSITIPKIVTIEDNISIYSLYNLIKGKNYGETEKIELKTKITEELRKRILEFTDMNYAIAYSGEVTFSFFNRNFTLPIIRKFECVKVKNLSRLKEKASILDIGDQIKIVYVPGGDKNKCSYTDSILSKKR